MTDYSFFSADVVEVGNCLSPRTISLHFVLFGSFHFRASLSNLGNIPNDFLDASTISFYRPLLPPETILP
jgi:hypothetical protein